MRWCALILLHLLVATPAVVVAASRCFFFLLLLFFWLCLILYLSSVCTRLPWQPPLILCGRVFAVWIFNGKRWKELLHENSYGRWWYTSYGRHLKRGPMSHTWKWGRPTDAALSTACYLDFNSILDRRGEWAKWKTHNATCNWTVEGCSVCQQYCRINNRTFAHTIRCTATTLRNGNYEHLWLRFESMFISQRHAGSKVMAENGRQHGTELKILIIIVQRARTAAPPSSRIASTFAERVLWRNLPLLKFMKLPFEQNNQADIYLPRHPISTDSVLSFIGALWYENAWNKVLLSLS